MRLLVLSDLHLEFGKFSPVHKNRRIDEGVDVVVLAGDIAEGVQGIRWARETFVTKEIVYVAGNHEFYDNNVDSLVFYLREVAQRMGVYFLDRDAVHIDGVRFLGTTLWTDFELFGSNACEESIEAATLCMNDFRYIKTSHGFASESDSSIRQRCFTPADAIREHALSTAWLEAELATGEPERTIVVTHHAPHMKSVELQYANDQLSGAYASDLTRLLGKSRFWLHGHMHSSSRYKVSGTEVIANPHGYRQKDRSAENRIFQPDLVIEI